MRCLLHSKGVTSPVCSVATTPKAPSRLSRCRAISGATPIQVVSADPVLFLASHGLEQREIEVAALRNPELLETDVTSRLAPMLRVFDKYGLQPHDVQDMLLCCPYLFNYSVDNKVVPCLEWLELQLGFTQQQVADVIKRFPAVLGYGVKSHLIPHMAYLKSLGVSEQRLPELVLERPYVLGAGIETLVKYLTREVRISRPHIGPLLRHFPFDYTLYRLRIPPRDAPSSSTQEEDSSSQEGPGKDT